MTITKIGMIKNKLYDTCVDNISSFMIADTQLYTILKLGSTYIHVLPALLSDAYVHTSLSCTVFFENKFSVLRKEN